MNAGNGGTEAATTDTETIPDTTNATDATDRTDTVGTADTTDATTDTAGDVDATNATDSARHAAPIIDVAIVDNDAITLHALRALLERTDGLRVPWVARSGREALVACLTDDRRPDVLLLDAELGDMSGMEVCRRLRAEDGRTGILVVTAYPVECFAAGAARAGAQGIVGKADYPWLVSAIRAVAAGRTFANPRIPIGAAGVGSSGSRTGVPTDGPVYARTGIPIDVLADTIGPSTAPPAHRGRPRPPPDPVFPDGNRPRRRTDASAPRRSPAHAAPPAGTPPTR